MMSNRLGHWLHGLLVRIMPSPKAHRRRQKVGGIIGFGVGLTCVMVLVMPGEERFHVKGAMNVGHEQLSCSSCHQSARGTIRQQIQANAKFLLGVRESPVDFGYRKVTNTMCLECHDRPNDRHPVFRFFELRFAEARKMIQPQNCISCHLEHSGKRVTISEITYCVHCHKKTVLKNDPITISHEELILGEKWESCLGCHDFHGNHEQNTKIVVEEALTSEQIREYFSGGSSPYSDTKYYKARQEVTNG